MKASIILGIILVVAAVLIFAPSPTEGPQTAHAGSSLPGDANCDGTVNSIDAAFVLQSSAGLLPVLPCPDNADANGDGQVNALDAALILQFAAGLITHIGPTQPPTSPVPSATAGPPTVVPPTVTPSQLTPTPVTVEPGGSGIRHCWLATVSARLLGILDFPDFQVPGLFECGGPSQDDVTYVCDIAADSSAACVTLLGPDYFCTFIRIEIGDSGFYNSKLDCDVIPSVGADGPDYFCDEGPGLVRCETRQGQGWPDYTCGIMEHLDSGVRMQCSTIHDDFPNFECLIKGVAFDCTEAEQ